MKTFFKAAIVSLTMIAFAMGTLIAQLKPGAASPISNVKMPAVSTKGVARQSMPPRQNSITSVSSSELSGGNRLVFEQYTDGGWGWPLVAPPTFGNILGPVAMGLAQAYQQTGNASQKTALTNAGTYLLTKTNNFSPSDGYLAAMLDRVLGVATYTPYVKANFYDKLAAGTYNRNGLGTLYTTASYINLIKTNRGTHAGSGSQGNLAAWDIGMGLVGAAMCGASTVDWIAGVKLEIDLFDVTGDYDVIGLAGAIYGLAFVGQDYNPSAGDYASANNINDLAAILTSYQISGGGFTWTPASVNPGDETNQETAYAILALNQLNRTTYLADIQGAANYLLGVQLGTNGWNDYVGDPDENNEVTGEVLWGISAAYPPPVHNITKDVYYPTIQGAVTDAAAGNTITVAAGSYNEAVSVNKSVTLNGVRAGVDARGRTGSESILLAQTGGASAMSISANNVTIDGFTIQGAGTAGGAAFGINAAAGTPTSGVHITNNIFQNLYEGAHVQGPDANVSSSMTIDKNAFFDDPGDLFAKDAGIWMASAPSHNLTITNNSFSGHDAGDGGDYAAVNIDRCANLTITNNTSHNDGSFLVLVDDTTVNVSGNSSSNSGPSGFHESSCMFLALGNSGVTIQNNSLDAGYRGVRLATFFGTGINHNIQVLNNTITNMVDAGILVPVGTVDDQVIVHGNQIAGNLIGVQNDNTSPSTMVNATNNYWGTLFGPSDPTGTIEVPTSPAPSVANMKNTIPPGNLGDGVSENVNYFPWTGKTNHGAHGGGISAGAYGSPTSNPVFAGVDPAALDGVDSRDTVAPPPPPSNYVYLYFLLDPGNPLPNYSVDVKKDEASLAAAAKAWNLKALSDLTTHLITMELPVDPTLPSGFKPTLYDLATNNYVDLRSTPFYLFTTPASVIPTDFRLLIGDSTKPNVAVTAPNGGEFLVVGSPYNITWTSSDGTGVLRHYVYYSLTGGAPYTFIDSTNPGVHTLAWTPPSAASVASIKVVARDSVLNEQTDVSDHSFTILATNSISFSAQAGWNLVSPAMQQGTMTPAAVFGDDYGATPYFTFQYSPLSGYSIPATLNMGQGYWLGSNSAQVIDAVGTPVSSASLGLAAGFNIVGNPFPVAEPKDSLKFTDGFVTKTMAQAASAGWLSNVLYGYSGTSYFVENSALAVWNGYWIPMLLSGKTIQYTPAVGVPTPKVGVIAEAATQTHWSVDLSASMAVNGVQFGDRIASFGVREDAGDSFNPMYDAPRPPRAPSNDFVEISFPARGEGYPIGFNSYARDFRSPAKAAWTFVVRSSTEGTVTLTWDRSSIAGLSADVQIELYDGASRRGIDMKQAGSYTYEQDGTTHEFTVNSQSGAVPQQFGMTQNYPNPFNPTTKISYALPYDAKVQVSVYDFLGEKVAELVNQTLTAGYHEVVFDASRLASGMYFYRITATSDNGAGFTSSKKMMLMK